LPQAKKLDFLYFDAGGGHRSAALALKSVMEAQDRGWQIELVNLQEVLDPLDIFRKVTGIRLQDIYNLFLAKGWTLGSEYLLPLMHGVIRLYHKSQVKLLTSFWAGRRTDLVVSLIPNFNRAVFESLKAATPHVDLVTILTDLADFPPHFWMEKQPQYFICGTDRAVEQALGMGHPKNRVLRVSGMILRPTFYDVAPVNKQEELLNLGLNANTPTGLLLFGAQGSPVMYEIAKRIGEAAANVQLIAVCGHNAKLKQKIEALKTRNKIHVVGFTQQIPFYMCLSDFFIGKPGPGSISEAVKMHLPVIVEENAFTLPQERYNAAWVREQKIGIVLKSFRQIESAIAQLLTPGTLAQMRRQTACLDNQAVFEIAQILDKLSSRTTAPA
jgi:1,2-diacylglycerol 3-beta-galactosyltransferase